MATMKVVEICVQCLDEVDYVDEDGMCAYCSKKVKLK